MKKLIPLLLVVFCGSFLSRVEAQDIHFSQFYMSPLNLNPAMTGVNNCKTRLIVNYRNQWASALQANAYNTYSASYDQKVAVGRTDYFGIGGSVWGDVAGATRFGTTQGRMSLSYSKKVGGYRKSAKYIVIGADAAITQRRISQNDLRWPVQHDGNGGYNEMINPNEPIANFDFLYADVAAGLLFFNVMDQYNNWYAGMAMHHLNQADVSFYDEEVVSLYSRFTIHGGGQFELTRRVSLIPNIVFLFQGQHREYNGGTSLRFALGNSRVLNQSWQLGLWYRAGTQDSGGLHSDAIILSTRFNYDHFGIGFSYDSTISKYSEAGTANGAFEFSMTYEICGPEKRAVYCPRF